jgi:hypothetical protein
MRGIRTRSAFIEKRLSVACLALLAGTAFLLSAIHVAKAEMDYDRLYQAVLNPINTRVSGEPVAGSATLKVKGSELTISVVAQGFKPDQHVMMHFHGFPGGAEEGLQPSFEVMDANSDGVVDVVEINSSVGLTMVPFNGDPAALDIKGPGYPQVREGGWVRYKKTVDLKKLIPAMEKKFDIENLRLDERHVVVHGVSKDAKLPESAESVLGAPAHATLPVAYGEIEMIKGGTDATALRY